jgi:hypothetical protein
LHSPAYALPPNLRNGVIFCKSRLLCCRDRRAKIPGVIYSS